MASLLAPLASGMNGAASGTAEIYTRGTAVASGKVYSDKNNVTAVTSHPLDANGRVIRYVTESVDVIVKDSSGTPVATFTWEDNAANVEIQNAAATGTNPQGQSGTGLTYRTNLDAFLTSLQASLGAPDGKVLVSGTAFRLQDAIGSGVFYNVKTTYGAKGDGVSNDLTAIQAAITAAYNAGGGIVYFPPGTYLCNGQLSVLGKVQLWGAQAAVTTLKQGSAGTYTLTVSGADVVCRDLTFNANATTSGAATLSSTDTRFENCDFTQPTANQIINVASSATAVFHACQFALSQASAKWIAFDATALEAHVQVIGGRVVFSANNSAGVVSAAGTTAFLSINGTLFRNTLSSNVSLISNGGTQFTVALSGCQFDAFDVNFKFLLITTYSAGAHQTEVYEAGCHWYNTNTILSWNGEYPAYSAGREGALRTASSGTAYTPDAHEAVNHQVISNGASMAINNPSLAATPTGRPHRLRIYYKNTNGGAITPTFGAAYKVGTIPNIASGSAASWEFQWESTVGAWVQIGGNSSAFVS